MDAMSVPDKKGVGCAAQDFVKKAESARERAARARARTRAGCWEEPRASPPAPPPP